MRKITRNNLVRQRSFSDRLLELMRKYTNQQLTAAEITAELIAMAKGSPLTPAAETTSPAAQR